MKQKNLILLGILIAGLICAGIFLRGVYVSWQSEILRLQTETKKLQAKEKFLSKFADDENFEKFMILSEENFLAAREFLPADSEQEKFTDAIYRAANKNNVSVNALTVAEPMQVEENFFRQAVKVQFTAAYVDLLNFLREVLDGKRFATLNNVSVAGEDDLLNCEAEFFIYFARISD